LLTKAREKKYTKNSTDMYYSLLDSQYIAFDNARRLRESKGDKSELGYDSRNNNPCTKVDLLVEELNDHLKQ
jgi:hypothetical protein